MFHLENYAPKVKKCYRKPRGFIYFPYPPPDGANGFVDNLWKILLNQITIPVNYQAHSYPPLYHSLCIQVTYRHSPLSIPSKKKEWRIDPSFRSFFFSFFRARVVSVRAMTATGRRARIIIPPLNPTCPMEIHRDVTTRSTISRSNARTRSPLATRRVSITQRISR